mmetsp:Transcript_26648/g.41711  ORF Transcript_26648/g.41711 Transcript_26648/m.41711 type:complete len:128 (-) Transcript_26648:1280-1663(-)
MSASSLTWRPDLTRKRKLLHLKNRQKRDAQVEVHARCSKDFHSVEHRTTIAISDASTPIPGSQIIIPRTPAPWNQILHFHCLPRGKGALSTSPGAPASDQSKAIPYALGLSRRQRFYLCSRLLLMVA